MDASESMKETMDKLSNETNTYPKDGESQNQMKPKKPYVHLIDIFAESSDCKSQKNIIKASTDTMDEHLIKVAKKSYNDDRSQLATQLFREYPNHSLNELLKESPRKTMSEVIKEEPVDSSIELLECLSDSSSELKEDASNSSRELFIESPSELSSDFLKSRNKKDPDNLGNKNQSLKSGRALRPRRPCVYFAVSEDEASDNSTDSNKMKNRRRDRSKRLKSDTEDEFSDYSSDSAEWKQHSKRNSKSQKKKSKGEKKSQRELSEYEKSVQKNVDDRLAFLESLKIDEIKENFLVSVKKLKPAKQYTKKDWSSVPRRKSDRVVGESDNDFIKKVLSRRKEEADDELSNSDESEEEEGTNEQFPSVIPFEKVLHQGKQFSDFIEDFDELEVKEKKHNISYVSQLKEIKTCITTTSMGLGKIHCLSVHPACDRTISIAGDSYGSIGFWNIDSDSSPYVFKPHQGIVSEILINSFHPHQIISCSRDKAIYSGDINKYIFTKVYTSSHTLTCFDILNPTTLIVGGNLKVSVINQQSDRLAAECESPVSSVCVHPTMKNYFLTSERNGEIRLWDLRKTGSRSVYSHPRRARTAIFSPLTGNSILSTSNDGAINVFVPNNERMELKTTKRFLEEIKLPKKSWKNKASKLTKFRATWVPNTDDTFIMGTPNGFQIFDINGIEIHNFQSGNQFCYSLRNAFHPHLPSLFGTNLDKKVFFFSATE